MSIINDLKELDELYRSGSLSEAEFERAKAAILAESNPTASNDSSEMNSHLAELVRQQELARIDREWDHERERYMVSYGHGDSHHYGRRLPSRTMAVIGGVAVIGFGVFFTVMSASMGGGLFSLFGVGVAALGLFFSIYEFGRAEKYEAAQGEYRERRNNMMRENEAIEEPDLNPFPNDERSDEQPLHSIFK